GAGGIALVLSWQTHLAGEYRAVFHPLAEESSREQALERTAAALWRPLTAALCADGAAMLVLAFSDVPILRALGYLSAGWIAGLLLSLWTLLPLWSSLMRLQGVPAAGNSTGEPP